MSNLRTLGKLDDISQRERRMERAEDRRDTVVFALTVSMLLAVLAAVAGWWLYLAGHGCGVTQ